MTNPTALLTAEDGEDRTAQVAAAAERLLLPTLTGADADPHICTAAETVADWLRALTTRAEQDNRPAGGDLAEQDNRPAGGDLAEQDNRPAGGDLAEQVYAAAQAGANETQLQDLFGVDEDQFVALYAEAVRRKIHASRRAEPEPPAPSWLTAPCPAWCDTDHAEADHPDDRVHLAGGDYPTVPLTQMPQVMVSLAEHGPAQIGVHLEQRADSATPVLALHRDGMNVGGRRGGPTVKLTPGEARQFAALLVQVADVADGTVTP